MKNKPLINNIVEDGKFKDDKGYIGKVGEAERREIGEGEHSAILP
jgi:hypothetical protein